MRSIIFSFCITLLRETFCNVGLALDLVGVVALLMALHRFNVEVSTPFDERVRAALESWGALYHALGTIHQGAAGAAGTICCLRAHERSCSDCVGRNGDATSRQLRAAHQRRQVRRLPFRFKEAPLRLLLLRGRGRGRLSGYDQGTFSILAGRRRRIVQHPLALVDLRADVIVARFGGLTDPSLPDAALRRLPRRFLQRFLRRGLQRPPARSGSRRWCVCHRAPTLAF